jgi:hypothetical protein
VTLGCAGPFEEAGKHATSPFPLALARRSLALGRRRRAVGRAGLRALCSTRRTGLASPRLLATSPPPLLALRVAGTCGALLGALRLVARGVALLRRIACVGRLLRHCAIVGVVRVVSGSLALGCRSR